jgi:hypothetical protein
MKLAAVLREIEMAAEAITVPELAARLGVAPLEVASMLTALRAAGRVGPPERRQKGTEECAAAGSCSTSCPGAPQCPFTGDVVAELRIVPSQPSVRAHPNPRLAR